jgi:hypothetical protein
VVQASAVVECRVVKAGGMVELGVEV